MRNNGTHIPNDRDSEPVLNRMANIYLKLRGKFYTFINARRLGKVGYGFYSPGPIHIVNGKRITVGDNVFLGEQCQIYAYNTGEIIIEDNVSIDRYVEIRGGKRTVIEDNVRIVKGATIKSSEESIVTIGSRTIISQGCIINGDVQIGKDVIFGPSVFVNAADHGFLRTDIPMNKQPGIKAPVVIEDDVWVGYNASILKGAKVSKGSIVGTGAVVTKSTQPFTINVGIPSNSIKSRN